MGLINNNNIGLLIITEKNATTFGEVCYPVESFG